MRKALILLVITCMAGAYLSFGCAKQKTSSVTPNLQKIHFDFDSPNIKAEYEPVLRDNATWMQNNKKAPVTIEGHCDERGSVEYNIALGDKRANAAKNYMRNLGVEDSRMSTISYGEERSICVEHNESCWWQNRRAEFISNK